jgi:hypothetical protein
MWTLPTDIYREFKPQPETKTKTETKSRGKATVPAQYQ